MSTHKKKRNIAIAILSIAMVLGATESAGAVEWNTKTELAPQNVLHMPVYGHTLPPIGFVNFCASHTVECTRPNESVPVVRMSNRRWLELVGVNEEVNRSVRPVTDLDKYNVLEHWTYPNGEGDCEDYVLLKKRRLTELGWPASALLITVVRDEKGDGHAVLTVTTDVGDFVLDNRTQEILPWRSTPYSFVKRQSRKHPYAWVSLAPRYGLRRTATSSDREFRR